MRKQAATFDSHQESFSLGCLARARPGSSAAAGKRIEVTEET